MLDDERIQKMVDRHQLLQSIVSLQRELQEKMQQIYQLKLGENSAFIRTITQSIPLMIMAKEAESGRIVFWNRMTEELTGIKASDAIGKKASQLFGEEANRVFAQGESEALRTEASVICPVTEIVSPSLGPRKLRAGITPLSQGGKSPIIITYAQDVSSQHEAEREAERQRLLSKAILDSLETHVVVLDQQGVIIAVNEPWLVFGRDRGALGCKIGIGINYLDQCRLLPGDEDYAQARAVCTGLAEVLAGKRRAFSMEYECSDGASPNYFLMNINPLRLDDCQGAVVSHTNITARKQAELLLRENHHRVEQQVRHRTAELQLFENIFRSALEGITVTNTDGTIINVNDAFTAITGYDRSEVLGKNPRILKSDRHGPGFYEAMWKQLLRQGAWEGEIWNRRKNGEIYPEWLSINAIRNRDGETSNYVAVFHDITELKEKEERIRELAYHDALTGLPNRALLLDRLNVALEQARRDKEVVALFFLDLDNFKHINDSLGHPVGDALLSIVADHLSSLVRQGDTVARLGGDEFVVFGPFEQKMAVSHLADRILASFEMPFHIKHHEFHISPSIGIAISPDDGENTHKLLQNADMALYEAKRAGKNCYRLFDHDLNVKLMDRLSMEKKLRAALLSRSFQVNYQPQINLADGKTVGLEALVRWRDEDGSLVPPDRFIPIAEEIGLINELGLFVLEQACLDTKLLHGAGFSDLRISVNLSAVQFKDQELAARIMDVLRRIEFDPAFLELEITETIMMSDVESTEKILNELAEHGIRLSVDDFGTGYSSLYYLKRFPVSALKIDRSFVRDLSHEDNDKAIVTAVLTMANSLKLKTVAEGVEDGEQSRYLREQGCDKAQGFWYSKPLPYEELVRFLGR